MRHTQSRASRAQRSTIDDRIREGSSRGRGRSAIAVLAGLVTVVLLSLATDQLFHALGVYPPWGEPMHDPALNVLALSYRLVYTVAGTWLTARIAPRSPMAHALIGGSIGMILAGAGAAATIPMDLGPAWYPIALVLTALPCAWLGGTLEHRRRGIG